MSRVRRSEAAAGAEGGGSSSGSSDEEEGDPTTRFHVFQVGGGARAAVCVNAPARERVHAPAVVRRPPPPRARPHQTAEFEEAGSDSELDDVLPPWDPAEAGAAFSASDDEDELPPVRRGRGR